MKYGAQNQIRTKVTSVKKGDVMSLIKFSVSTPNDMASVIITESAEALGLKTGDEVQLVAAASGMSCFRPMMKLWAGSFTGSWLPRQPSNRERFEEMGNRNVCCHRRLIESVLFGTG